jgi:hypothetical protein
MRPAPGVRFPPETDVRLRPIADISGLIDIGSMPRWIAAIVLFAVSLSGCSSGYEVLAIAQGGREDPTRGRR